MEPTYLRGAAERVTCRLWSHHDNFVMYNDEAKGRTVVEPSLKLYADLRHGDILHASGAFKGDFTYVVLERDGVKTVELVKVAKGTKGIIEREVSKLIEDPINFYTDLPEAAGIGAIVLS